MLRRQIKSADPIPMWDIHISGKEEEKFSLFLNVCSFTVCIFGRAFHDSNYVITFQISKHNTTNSSNLDHSNTVRSTIQFNLYLTAQN